MNDDEQSDIRTKDLIAMAFLKTKYWGIFRDIESNRDIYTQIRPEDSRYHLLFDDKDEREYRNKHFNDLFEKLGYTASDDEILKTILNETFPGWNGGPGTSEDVLRFSNRIGHRDLLDMYFAYGVSQQSFKKHMQRVKVIVGRASKDSEKMLLRKFRDFNRYALSQDNPGDVARLLARSLLREQEGQNGFIIVWRSWLHACLQYEQGANEATNSILASILSGANETVQSAVSLGSNSTAPTIDHRVDVSISFFDGITSPLKDPYLALLLLLFVLPERGNGFFLDYINRMGYEQLFSPVLGYVDEYFIGRNRNVFHEYDWPYWSFVLYQWSLSISQGDVHINQSVVDAVTRHRKVNDYVFSLLNKDAKLSYTFIRQQFWSNDGWNSESYRWRIENKIGQYNNEEDCKNILHITGRAITSKALSSTQKTELEDFKKLFDQFIEKFNTK